tara:strand:+ start:417 stop:1208 length:792 start_codon:yes stop_codon:yes gene_type:complete
MGANLDIGVLRGLLGEQSAAVWSDLDLRQHVSLSNLTVWKIISDLSPRLVTFPYQFALGNDVSTVTMTDNVTSITSGTIDKESGIGVRVSSISAVYETASSDPSSGPWLKMAVKNAAGHYPAFETSNKIFNDLQLPDLYQTRVALWDYGSQGLQIWPKPPKDHTYLVLLVPETPIYIKTGAPTERTPDIISSNSNDSEVLGAERFAGEDGNAVALHAGLAVVLDAAYRASFVDKSMRREFAAERDRLLAMMTAPTAMSDDEAY